MMLDLETEVEMKLPGRFQVSPQIAGAIKAVSGVVDVQTHLAAERRRRKRRISLLLPKIPLYSAPSHTETWLKRPSGGSRAA